MRQSLARHVSMFLVAVTLVASLGIASSASPARAAVGITVNTTADELNSDGDCSLREAIQAANSDLAVDACVAGSGSDTVNVPAGTYTLTIPGAIENGNATGDLDISGNISISGAGSANTIIQAGTLGYPDPSANGIDGVFDITGNYAVSFDNVTIANGINYGGIQTSFSGGSLSVTNSRFVGNSGGYGPAIANFAMSTVDVTNTSFINNYASSLGGAIYTQSGTTTIKNSSFLDNAAAQGGALMLYGDAIVANSTFSGNTAQLGGAIYVGNSSTATLTNNTIAYNTSTGSIGWAGGVFSNGSTVHLNNNIIANNTANGFSGDCRRNSGTETVDGANNLIETDGVSTFGCGGGTTNLISNTDPKLASLTGSPAYFELISDSPAMNAGDDSVCAAAPVSNTSQNGATRPVGAHCEIGSYEGTGAASPAVGLSATSINFGWYEVGASSSAQTVTVTNTGAGNLNIGTVSISGDFSLSNDGCTSASLSASGTCSFDVTFSPSASGTRTGSVSIPSNAASSPDSISLTGTGYTTGSSTFTSVGTYDGYVTESGENTSVGGSGNAIAATIMVGDNQLNRQIMGFLHFDTASLPDNAIVTGVMLRIKRQSVTGTNPFLTHGALWVDYGAPFFGIGAALKPDDFQASSSTNGWGPFNSTLQVGNWYEADVSGGASYVNLAGTTQFRLYFNLDDNNDYGADLLRFYSGNYLNPAYRPALIVYYILP